MNDDKDSPVGCLLGNKINKIERFKVEQREESFVFLDYNGMDKMITHFRTIVLSIFIAE